MNPTKYKPEYPKMLIDHMSTGLSYDSFGAVAEVGKQTMYDWEKRHTEWKEAKLVGFNKAQIYLERRLMAKISGAEIKGLKVKNIDTSCLLFALKTRFHETYGDRSKIDQTIEQKGDIKIVIDSDDEVL